MRIYCNDGGVLECAEVEITDSGDLLCDEYLFIPLREVVRITDGSTAEAATFNAKSFFKEVMR